MSLAWAAVGASGFSQCTCLPAAMAASAMGACNTFGVVMLTTSTLGSETSARQSPVERANPRSRAAAAAASGVTSASISSTGWTGMLEDTAHGLISERVSLAHEPRADETDPKGPHGFSLPSWLKSG